MDKKEKVEFQIITKWFDLEKEIENMEILNSIQFGMFIFYRKSFRRYKLMHEDYNIDDFKCSKNQIENKIIKLNDEIANVLNSISEDINSLIINENNIMSIYTCIDIKEIIRDCSSVFHPGLPFGIISGGKKLDDNLQNYLKKFKLLDKYRSFNE